MYQVKDYLVPLSVFKVVENVTELRFDKILMVELFLE